MDSDSPHPHQQHHHHHHHHHQQQYHHHLSQQQQHHQHIMVGPTNTVTNAPPSMPMMMPPQQQQQLQIQNSSHTGNSNSGVADRFPFNSVGNSAPAPQNIEYSDGSPQAGSGLTIDPARKKRGRPRKYSPDGNISLALSPTPVTPAGGHVDYSGGGGGGGGSATPSSEPTGKRRGRPPGSGKKQLDALGTTGIKFTPHVILVKAGKDIASKIMAFAEQGPRAVCILSANGAICNVTLRQPAMSSGTVTYEGRFEIISLSGSFLPPENNGGRPRTSGLSISLAGSDGRVLGGGVAGMLMAASPVQVIVGSFIADGKKSKSVMPPAPAPNMLNFGAPLTGASPPSEEASSGGDSSDESGDNPLNRVQGYYGNSSQQPLQSVPMYTNMGWPNSTMKMHPN